MNDDKTINKYEVFTKELMSLINRLSLENESNTPDYILAEYLANCLWNWKLAIHSRDIWNRPPNPLESEKEIK